MFLEYYNGLDLLEIHPNGLGRSFPRRRDSRCSLTLESAGYNGTSRRSGVYDGEGTETGRYRNFIMVDQEALESVLSSPLDYDRAGNTGLVPGLWT